MKTGSGLSIGYLAKAAGTKVVTVRYYEKVGLLSPPERTTSNYRAYGKQHLLSLRFIRRCRSLGFTIDQIRDLLLISSRKEGDCGNVDKLAAEHLAEVESKISDLKRLAQELKRINACCEGGLSVSDCRIIEALSREPDGHRKAISAPS